MLRNATQKLIVRRAPSSFRHLLHNHQRGSTIPVGVYNQFGLSSASFATKAAAAAGSETSVVADAASSAKCPFTGRQSQRDLSTAAVTHDDKIGARPVLKDVPAVPIFGSFISAVPLVGNFLNDNIYKLPTFVGSNAYDYYYQMYERFGQFYSVYIPGLGQGIYPKCYMIMDPDEMKKVIRQEGAYPRGGVEGLKAMIKWMKKQDFKLVSGKSEDDNGFLGRGESWRRIRNFLQTDLLSPQAANGYVPGVVEAAQTASKGAQAHAKDLNTFLNYAAFDMFQSIMFGDSSKLADPNTPSDPTDVEFCRLAVDSLAYLIKMQHDKMETIKFSLGIETQVYRNFENAMDGLKEVVMAKLNRFKERAERGELNEIERQSYFAHALERQKSDDNDIGEDELMQIALIMLNASVDTTSAFISWAMVHLSVNEDAQEKLYQELKRNVDENYGTLTPDMLTRAKAPYLNAFLRESHRMTPVMPTIMLKSNSVKDIDIHGITIPKDSLIGFDSFSLGMDPKVIDDPETFRPERWINEAEIEARKGTPAEALDSIFFRDPFSQGARRCPGSRVAVNETQVILGQIALDWKITAPDHVKTYKDVPYEIQTLLVPRLPEMKMEARN